MATGRRTPQAGFILFIVLILFTIIIFISASTLWQLQQNVRLRGQTDVPVENILHDLTRQIPVRCLVPPQLIGELLQKDKSWWQSYACKRDNYFYIYEKINLDPCVHIANKAAQYYRLTVVTLANSRQDREMFMQSIFVFGADASQKCEGKIRNIAAGEQARRIL